MSKKTVKSAIGTRDDKQWPTEGGALKDGCTGVADASARASWCVCRVAQATIPSLTARHVTGAIEKLTPSSRRAEGASLLEHLRSRSSVDSTRCDRADPLGSTDDEVRMGAQPPLVVMVFECGCFFTISQLGLSLRTGAADSSANHVLQRGAGLSVRCISEAVRLSRCRHQFACATGRVDCELQQRRP